MSAEIFRNACVEAGLYCQSQELLTWAEGIMNDCISVCRRPDSSAAGVHQSKAPQVEVHEHPLFREEAGNLRRITRIYGSRST